MLVKICPCFISWLSGRPGRKMGSPGPLGTEGFWFLLPPVRGLQAYEWRPGLPGVSTKLSCVESSPMSPPTSHITNGDGQPGLLYTAAVFLSEWKQKRLCSLLRSGIWSPRTSLLPHSIAQNKSHGKPNSRDEETHSISGWEEQHGCIQRWIIVGAIFVDNPTQASHPRKASWNRQHLTQHLQFTYE